jgi:DNA-binding MarR family transcriptional regulator
MIDPLKSLPGYVLRRASSKLAAELGARLAPLGLRSADVSVLLLIDANPGVTQSELGRVLDIQRANMNPLVTKLSARGLVERQKVDGRSQGLALTQQGRSLTEEARIAITTFEDQLLLRMPVKLRPHLLPLLSALWGGD